MIAASPEEHVATGGVSFSIGSGPPQTIGVPRAPKVKQQPAVKEEGHKTKGQAKRDKNGFYTFNVKGWKICYQYNMGKYTGKCPNGDNHQCSVCLDNTHHAKNCPQAAGGAKPKGKGKKY